MEDRQHLILPVTLYALAGGALALTLLALSVGGESEPAPWGRQAERAYHRANRQPRAHLSGHRPPTAWSLQPLLLRPVDYVRCTPGPVATPIAPGAAPPPSFLAVLPAAPEWTADGSPSWKVAGVGPREAGRGLGAWLAQQASAWQVRVDLRHVDLGPLVRQISRHTQPRRTPLTRHTTPARSVKVGPGDRLAMAARGAAAAPSFALPLRQPESPRTALAKPRVERRHETVAAAVCQYDCVALRASIIKLDTLPEASDWARVAMVDVDTLASGVRMADDAYLGVAERLAAHAARGRVLADQVRDNRTAVLLRKASYAIDRRVYAWQIARRLEQRRQLAQHTSPRPRAASSAVAAGRLQPSSWRTHLRCLQADAQDSWLFCSNRLPAPQGRPAKRRAAFAPLASASGSTILALPDPVDVSLLIQDMEQYELKPRGGLAERIAMCRNTLLQSGAEDHRRLASRINQDYRNANLRVAISREMLRRQLPKPEPQQTPVWDRIAGTPVRGTALTNTDLAIRLQPDPHAWRMTLVARGLVETRTVADGGAARVHSRGTTTFTAEKPLLLHRGGVVSSQTRCQAHSNNRLTGVRTDFDSVPLVAGLARSRAEDEFQANLGRARWRSESRISDQVRAQLDEQSQQFLSRMESQYQDVILARAQELGVAVEPVEIRTTDTRLIARLRVANDQQLAAHTPRNRAPADSVVSVQVHESLVNNTLADVAATGVVMTPAELRGAILAKLKITAPAAAEPAEQHDARLVLAAEQPLRVSLQQGQVDVVMSFDELVAARSRFRDFKVHTLLTPTATLDGVWLTQHEPVQIEGRLRSAKRAKLHAVFAKALPAGTRFRLLQTTPPQRERLEGLMVTQVVVDDGWLGLALGPRREGRTALRERFVR